MIKMTAKEYDVLGLLIKDAGRGGVQTYFAKDNDDNSTRLSVMIRNNVNTLTEELTMLSEIAAGNVEILYEFIPGDIGVRTEDNGSKSHRRAGYIFQVKVTDTDGVEEANGQWHGRDNIRPATDVEKAFYKAGRQRVEFEDGDRVYFKGSGVRVVGGFNYPAAAAMEDLESDRIDIWVPVDYQFRF